MSDDPRIIELESKLTFQEQTLEDLNQALLRISDELQQTQKRVRLLEERLASSGGASEPGVSKDLESDRPPHY